MSGFSWHKFSDQEAMVSALRALVAARLKEGIMSRAAASLMVSGGSTPKPLYEKLSTLDLAWDRVTIGLVDDRWVPEDHPRSNALMVRQTLLQNKAAHARFVAMKTDDDNPCDAVREITSRYSTIPAPYDLVLLGMGSDGHTASLFPGAQGLDHAMKVGRQQPVAAITAQKSAITGDEVQRMTLTKKAITSARDVVLMVSGAEKADVLKRAEQGDTGLPIARVAEGLPGLLNIYWAP